MVTSECIAGSTGHRLAEDIRSWALELGFSQLGISDIDLSEHEDHLRRWLAAGYQGEMAWMGAHGNKRSRPDELVPGTCRVLSLRMDYLPDGAEKTARIGGAELVEVRLRKRRATTSCDDPC